MSAPSSALTSPWITRPHFIEGDQPFGLTRYGFFEATSYGDRAGMNLFKAP